ncbi:MAG: hypothetical protein GY862_28230 [Gammaproteobacteria bacterium]|nr:hypothetical protein [Gammaproteobacteria bacterium]
MLKLQTVWLASACISIVAGFLLVFPWTLLLAIVFTLLVILGKDPVQRVAGWVFLVLSALLAIPVYVVSYRQPREAPLEALVLLSGLKIPVEAFCEEKKYCPTPEEVNARFASAYVTRIVRSSPAHSAKCVYTATLKDDQGFGANATLGLAYLIEQQTWSCKPTDTGSTTIDPAYLPFACKDDEKGEKKGHHPF